MTNWKHSNIKCAILGTLTLQFRIISRNIVYKRLPLIDEEIKILNLYHRKVLYKIKGEVLLLNSFRLIPCFFSTGYKTLITLCLLIINSVLTARFVVLFERHFFFSKFYSQFFVFRVNVGLSAPKRKEKRFLNIS